MKVSRVVLFSAALAMVLGASMAQAKGAAERAAGRVDAILDKVRSKIKAKDLGAATALLRKARKAARRHWESLNRVTYYEATVQAYRHDFEKAASIIIERLPAAAKRRDHRREFWFHNNLMMLRAAQGDVVGALVECYELRTVGERGTWTMKDRPRMTQVRMKDFWHRALYLRLHAEQLKGAQRRAVLGYAENARRAYREIARPISGYGDSIAVLDVLFAVHAKDKRGALKAARKVDAGKNGDVEDLYFTHMGLSYGGDVKAAERVLEKMKNVPYVSHANAIMLMWIEREAVAKKGGAKKGGKTRWTPRFPTAPR